MIKYICHDCVNNKYCAYPTSLNEVIVYLCDNNLDKQIEVHCNGYEEKESEEDEL